MKERKRGIDLNIKKTFVMVISKAMTPTSLPDAPYKQKTEN